MTAPFMVMDTDIWSSGMPSNRIFMSSTRVDRHARLADIAMHARMIAVIAAMGGKIEGDAEPLLPGGEIAPVEGVGLLGGREAGILTDRPGPAGIHAGTDTARIRREAGQTGIGGIVSRVERRHGDAFRRAPLEVRALHFPGGERTPILCRMVRRFGIVGHQRLSNTARRFSRKAATPSRKSPVAPALRWFCASSARTASRSTSSAAAICRRMSPTAKAGA